MGYFYGGNGLLIISENITCSQVSECCRRKLRAFFPIQDSKSEGDCLNLGAFPKEIKPGRMTSTIFLVGTCTHVAVESM